MKRNTQRGFTQRGFTLVETLAAISLITVAIVAPMALTVQSLQGAYYARDQITASNLAQEGIEAVRSIRDGNVLASAEGNGTVTLFQGIPIGTVNSPVPFTVDGTQTDPTRMINNCSGTCGPLLTYTNATFGSLYGYTSGWTPTPFTRTMTATVVWSDNAGVAQEIRITSTVTWQTSSYKSEQIQLSEDLYNWVSTGSAV